MTNGSNEEKRFDFIVVGAGAAGSVLGAELSASGAQVLDAPIWLLGLLICP